MKKGYIVGEYIIVAFFFLILFVGIVDRVILVTSEELDLAQDHESCENAERIFKEIVDNENNVSKYGVSGGDSIVNYNATKYLNDNKNLGDYNNDTNKTDSFKLAYEIKGFDVQSAYSTPRTDITIGNQANPVAQIWLDGTKTTNASIVHNVIAVGTANNDSSTKATLKVKFVFPNGTKIYHVNDSTCSMGAGDSVTYDATPDYGTILDYTSVVGNGCDRIYVSYTTDQAAYTDWDEHWTRYGSNFQAINDIQRNNNLIFIRDISFRNEDLDKDYPIYIGNDTLAKLEWGAPLAEGCEYKRLYKVEANNSFLINQSVLTEQREVNITRNFIGEVKIISA